MEGMVAGAKTGRLEGVPPGSAKAAALLERLGKEASGEVLKRLTPAEVERLAGAFARMRRIPDGEREKLAEEALGEVKKGVGQRDVAEFAREVLSERLGAETANNLLGVEAEARAMAGSLDWMSDSAAEAVAAALEEENPGIAALVLSAARPRLAARVVSLLPDEARGQAMLALARGSSPMPEAVTAILERVGEVVSKSEAGEQVGRQARGPELAMGSGKVADILRQCDRNTARSVVDCLEEHAPEIAEEVSQSIFTSIGDLKWLDTRSLQLVMREVEVKDLARALRGAAEELRDLCFENLSENAAASLKDEIEALGPTPRRQVETAQQTILGMVREMLEAERIQVAEEEEDLV